MLRGNTSQPTASSSDDRGYGARTNPAGNELSRVGTIGSLLGLVSLALPWLNIRPNRLAAGQDVGLLGATSLPLAVALGALWIAAFALSLRRPTPRRIGLMGIIAAAALPVALFIAGTGATTLLASAPAVARASLGGAVWLSVLAVYLVLHSALSSMTEHRRLGAALALTGPVIVAAMAASGLFNNLSLVVEFIGNEPRFFQEVVRHLSLALGSVVIGAAIAIPLGLTAARHDRLRRPIFLVSNTVETIPSLALFGLIIAPLAALSFAYPALRDIGIRGVGAAPALIALVLYSLLPIVHNTYAGLKQVSPAALDAGLGMGMSRRQLSWRVEYPLALPLIGEGVRTATVQSIGNTAVAALIGAGGLGQFIFQGLGQAAPDLILMGALGVIALALTIDVVARNVIKALTPRGLRSKGGQ